MLNASYNPKANDIGDRLTYLFVNEEVTWKSSDTLVKHPLNVYLTRTYPKKKGDITHMLYLAGWEVKNFGEI